MAPHVVVHEPERAAACASVAAAVVAPAPLDASTDGRPERGRNAGLDERRTPGDLKVWGGAATVGGDAE